MHHSYIVPGIVDGAVVMKQAYARANDQRDAPEATHVHKHKHGEPCGNDCVIIEPGDTDV